jgi:hypothetical protein
MTMARHFLATPPEIKDLIDLFAKHLFAPPIGGRTCGAAPERTDTR